MTLKRRWFVRRGDVIQVRIPPVLRATITDAVDDLRTRLVEGGTDLDRLYPNAYPNHPGLEREYQKYMRDELLASRLSALEIVTDTVDTEQIDEGQAHGWLQAVNATRVVLGTMLGIDHDGWMPDDLGPLATDDPRMATLTLYEVLAVVLDDLLVVLQPTLGDQVEPVDPGFDPDD